MSILKYIMRPFVQFDENEQPETSQKPAVQADQNRNSSSNVEPPVTLSEGQLPQAPVSTGQAAAGSQIQSSASGNYEKHFEELIEEANANNPIFQGTDFKEFKDSMIDVEAIADEGTRYKTAFNVLKRTGLTKERLVSTGREYLNVIENDLKGFESAYTQEYKAEVEQKEIVLQQKAAELQSLNEKIADLNRQIKEISATVVNSKQKLNSNKAAFISAGESKKKELESELEKIDKYFL